MAKVKELGVIKRRTLSMHERGKSCQEIARTLGVQCRTVQIYIREHERSKMKPEDRIDTGKMMALFRAGWSVHDVAYEFSVSPADIIKSYEEHVGHKWDERGL